MDIPAESTDIRLANQLVALERRAAARRVAEQIANRVGRKRQARIPLGQALGYTVPDLVVRYRHSPYSWRKPQG